MAKSSRARSSAIRPRRPDRAAASSGDRIDGVSESAVRSGAYAAARDCHRQMRLAGVGAGPANQDDVALLPEGAVITPAA